MSGKDEKPKRFSVMIEDRPYRLVACGICYRNMTMEYIENHESVTFIHTCPVCGQINVENVQKSEIERIRNSYEIAEN